jgi:putative spermidine/putrescine transport system ATP-binding protein
MMSQDSLVVKGLSRQFGTVHALKEFDINIPKGELVALLGPSGCGKTTALRIIAGLEKSDAGSVILNGKVITSDAAHKRNMGMVFQAYSLFPHLNVADNVSFGLKMRKVSKENQKKRVDAILELVGLNSHHKRFAHQLSGGQQQRVALARALVTEPEVLLLDEPLSALDAQVRTNLREEIRRLQLSLGTTTLFVTHDQEEAMTISDRVGVMNSGSLEQIDTPDVLYNNPATNFVASFVGVMNKISSQLSDGYIEVFGKRLKATKGEKSAGQVYALIRPEAINVKTNASNPNAKVLTRSFLGASSNIVCQLADGTIVQSLMTSAGSGELHPGSSVELEVSISEVLITHD